MSFFSLLQQSQVDVIPVVVVGAATEEESTPNDGKSRRSRRSNQTRGGRKSTNTITARQSVSTTTTTTTSHQCGGGGGTISFGVASLAGVCLVVLVFVLSFVRIDTLGSVPRSQDHFRMATGTYNDSSIIPPPPSSSSVSVGDGSLVRPDSNSVVGGNGATTQQNTDSSLSPPTRRPNDGSGLKQQQQQQQPQQQQQQQQQQKKKKNRSANVGPLMKDGFVEVTFTDPFGGCRIAKLPRDRKFLRVESGGPKLSINDILADGRNTIPTKMALPKNLESYPCPPASARSY